MNAKQRVAEYAVSFVEDGMVVGLGTGSTADCFIESLARKYESGLQVRVVSSSMVSQLKAQSLGLPLISIDQINELDLYVDGADEVAPDLTLLKGQGADLVKEKILARLSEKFLVLVDESKLVDKIGSKFPVPVEVIPFAWQIVKTELERMNGKAELRRIPGKETPMLSSHGSFILDVGFSHDMNVGELNDQLNDVPGVVEHGIFAELVSGLLIGNEEGITERWLDQKKM